MGREKKREKETDREKKCSKPVVVVKEGGDREAAVHLAERLGTRYLEETASMAGEGEETKQKTEALGLWVEFSQDGTALTDGRMVLRADLGQMKARLCQDNLHRELLVKAAKSKKKEEHPLVIDATAGFGEDSLLLAAAGFQVMLYEYDPIIAALLRDALFRAKEDPKLGPVVDRMTLVEEDSIAALTQMEGQGIQPEVVFLDPMFPARQKSGLIKKKFQLLQQLESPCSTEEALLQAAMAAKPRKIVIKRPAKGPFLAGVKPDYSLDGKAIRYDCFVFAR